MAFRTIEESGPHIVTVRLDRRESDPAQDAVSVIDVPFEVPPGGAIEIGSISDSVLIGLPSALYQLRFECFERTSGQPPKVHLLFYKNDNPCYHIVRADSNIKLGTELLLVASPA